MKRIIVRASPSLALIKYWGKSNDPLNTPATSSLAVTLDGLHSTTEVTQASRDEVTIDSVPQPPDRFLRLFDTIRKDLETDIHFSIVSSNNFPTAGGLASSASGIAALVFGCARLLGSDASNGSLSSLARIGSASAARSLFEGFTILEADSLEAKKLYPKAFWPSFRVVVVAVTRSRKAISSREAMSRARRSSPYYAQWLESSLSAYELSLAAIANRNIRTLGELMRANYLAMFSTMFTSVPPIIYWNPDSLAVIHECESLRNQGIEAWETMDAGPQVKIATTKSHVDAVSSAIRMINPKWDITVCEPGDAPTVVEEISG